MSIFEDQREFMSLGGQSTDILNPEQAALYLILVKEEINEFLQTDNIPDSIKEAVDILVVTAGYLISLGIDAQKAWDLVHATNLAKVEGGVKKREDGKILKSEKYLAMKAELMNNIEGLL
jgi:predicted HAD superfamily Cof-like phosphohydrolase